jgi:enamine deaminase RidA (YjgF/YER057c/UK114 family)
LTELRHVYLQGAEIVEARGGGAGATPAEQLESAVAACRAALASQGFAPNETTLTRLWMSDRESGATLNEARDRLLRHTFRTASSSFFSRRRMPKGCSVFVEFYAVRPVNGASRRIVEFDPPRRYAHYLVVDDWLFLSGMAEEGETMDAQFDLAFAQVQAALDAERFDWSEVHSASLFLETGKAEANWLLERFRKAAPLLPPFVSLEMVDGLANTPKHLEIEIIARRKAR